MTKRMKAGAPSRRRVTMSLPTELVRRLDRESRTQGASRSVVAERWLRAGERQVSQSSLEQELEADYAQPLEEEECELSAALGSAARETAAHGEASAEATSRP